MFQRITFLTFFALGLSIFLWGLFFVRVRPRDIETCQKIQNEETAASSQGLINATHQRRTGVIKEIYFVQEDNSRLHYRIQAQDSLLSLKPAEEGKKIELNEKLEKIKCWMQDKLYETKETGPMQQIRFLEANDGLYCYTSQQFLAQSVALSLFRLQGQELPKELKALPFLKGVAQDVSFAVSGKTPQFKAQHFKAELKPTMAEKP